MAIYDTNILLLSASNLDRDAVCTFETSITITESSDLDPAIHGNVSLAVTAGFIAIDGPNTYNHTCNLAKTAGFYPNCSVSFVASAVTSNSLSFNHLPGGHYIFPKAITQSLTFTQVAARSLPTSINQTFTITETLSTLHIHFAHVSNHLSLTQDLERQMIYNRTFTDTINFSNGGIKLPFNIQVPGALGLVKPRKCLVILEVPEAVIVLPCPLLNDGQIFSGGKIDSKKSVINDWYVYIRHTNLEKLKYTFNMDYKKAQELRTFVANYGTKLLKMLNWKGELWSVLITNQPLEFVVKSRPERTEVTIEFEGVQYG